jgi:hypothetical protein
LKIEKKIFLIGFKMKKIGIVITDGVGFRNFVLSDFLIEAKKNFNEVVVLSCLPLNVYQGHCDGYKVIELPVFKENFINWFFRKTKEVAHLQLHQKDNFGIKDNLFSNKSKSNTPRGIAVRLIFSVTHFLNSEKWIQRFNKWQQLSFKNNSVTLGYKALLNKEKIDVLFFTHQRPSFIAPLAYQAEQLKIKTATFIFSWDNLASKGRMAANFDHYLVWSDLMKEELKHFYKSVKTENIEVVGTPQFEPYIIERYQMSKEDFFKNHDLDINKKTICFSCGDISTSKNDELYIELIANAILQGKIPDVNFIVRTSPAEDPIRFEKIVSRFSIVKWNFPKWNLSRQGHQETWTQRVPLVEDVRDLRALIEYTDLNVNMLSTMSLDFMQFDKPVINPVFGNEVNGLYNDQRFLNYKHIQYIVDSNATSIVKNEGELLNAINTYLENPNLNSSYRERLKKLQISKPIENTGKRIADVLYDFSLRNEYSN